MKKYIAVTENLNHVTHLKVEVYYSLGGYNCWNGKNERRGYYLSVCPVERRGNMESYVAFSGIKECLKEVSRKSSKAELAAENLAAEKMKDLINYILDKSGLQLLDMVA